VTVPSPPPALVWRPLGRIHYDAARTLQGELRESRLRGEGEDVLLTLEHGPVLTAGRRAQEANLLLPPERLSKLGVDIRHVERGGDWTFHGPGQLVAYPIVALRGWGLRVTDFVAGLERAMAALAADALRSCAVDPADAGIEIGRRCGHPGTWAFRPGRAPAKIGAVGVHFVRFVSMHGLALNLDPRPWGFDWIVPCGLLGAEVSSVRRLVEEAGGDAARMPPLDAAARDLARILPLTWRNPELFSCPERDVADAATCPGPTGA
jgi:lipoate-protein ligase B